MELPLFHQSYGINLQARQERSITGITNEKWVDGYWDNAALVPLCCSCNIASGIKNHWGYYINNVGLEVRITYGMRGVSNVSFCFVRSQDPRCRSYGWMSQGVGVGYLEQRKSHMSYRKLHPWKHHRQSEP